ncbi:MAG TPA: GNAT family N-acetyltransferase [Chloroflexota bacterium]|nr:GNAT family N-acetyltransferase [Chloroflexota bacterium]
MKIVPVTRARWADLETLFGPNGACAGCWCMWWRLTAGEYTLSKGRPNRDALRGIVEASDPPGLLAYDGDTPIGWLAIAPREDYPRWTKTNAAKESDRALRERGIEPPRGVWAATCFYVARSARRRGVTVALLEAAVRHARRHGAKVIEGFPLVPRSGTVPAAFAWTGFLSAFAAAGFEEVGRPSAGKRVMHYYLGTSSSTTERRAAGSKASKSASSSRT